MKSITNVDKNGKLISDLTKVKLPSEVEKSIFKILNPSLEFNGKAVKAQ